MNCATIALRLQRMQAQRVSSDSGCRSKTRSPASRTGPITASAIAASVDDLKQFANARQFGAWLGSVPSQNSTGGKASLGRITKRGDAYLRTLLIQGARSAVMSAGKRGNRISQWLVQLKERVGWQKAAVALANKNALILWAVLTRDAVFDANHVPEVPAARRSPKLQAAAP
jgi:transposase